MGIYIIFVGHWENLCVITDLHILTDIWQNWAPLPPKLVHYNEVLLIK